LKLKIVSDGTAPGTRIVDEAGNSLENVTYVEWHVAADNIGGAKIHIAAIPIEATGKITDGMRWLLGEQMAET